ncbi:hypothetical protein AB0D10_29485 [Kitasatospora sp. NPDC048545]|uniref:hypothetical protein n=1 Tax=Kitasatospora sp. NPDC048545 TaxID=3157208 RepID=UPI00340DBB6C
MTHHESGGPARLLVLADEQGNIIAASAAPEAGAVGADAPSTGGVRVSEGRVLHEVALPEGRLRAEAAESLGDFYVAVDGGEPRLVKRSQGSAGA